MENMIARFRWGFKEWWSF